MPPVAQPAIPANFAHGDPMFAPGNPFCLE
jgi:hypothetical protein